MPYRKHFQLLDDISAHFDGTVSNVDLFLQSRYVGFYAVASAAVIELALKDIFIAYGRRIHPIFGSYLEARYERINGRIGVEQILKEHLSPLGDTLRIRFKALVDRVDNMVIKKRAFSPRKSYDSLLVCRHEFAHQGSVPATATYNDVKRGFESGKIILACLAKVLE